MHMHNMFVVEMERWTGHCRWELRQKVYMGAQRWTHIRDASAHFAIQLRGRKPLCNVKKWVEFIISYYTLSHIHLLFFLSHVIQIETYT